MAADKIERHGITNYSLRINFLPQQTKKAMVKAATLEIGHHWKEIMSMQNVVRSIKTSTSSSSFHATSADHLAKAYASQPVMRLVGGARVIRHPAYLARLRVMLETQQVTSARTPRRVHFTRKRGTGPRRVKTLRRKGTPCRAAG